MSLDKLGINKFGLNILSIKETFNLNSNQENLIILASLTFIFQSICFYLMHPTKFQFKWCFFCFLFAFIYNISYYKFFIIDKS